MIIAGVEKKGVFFRLRSAAQRRLLCAGLSESGERGVASAGRVSEDLDRAMSSLQMGTTVDIRRFQPGTVAAQSDPVCWGGRGWLILRGAEIGCGKGLRSPLCFTRPCWAECGAGEIAVRKRARSQ